MRSKIFVSLLALTLSLTAIKPAKASDFTDVLTALIGINLVSIAIRDYTEVDYYYSPTNHYIPGYSFSFTRPNYYPPAFTFYQNIPRINPYNQLYYQAVNYHCVASYYTPSATTYNCHALRTY